MLAQYRRFYQGDNFCDFPCVLARQSTFKNGSTPTGKQMFTREANYFIFSVDSFLEGRQNNFDMAVSHGRVLFPFNTCL